MYSSFFPDMVRFAMIPPEFGRPCGVFSAPLLRVQSGGIPVARATSPDVITDRSASIHHALMGLRSVMGEGRLVLKLKKRKEAKTDAFLTTPCLHRGNFMGGSGFFPIHDTRPSGRERGADHGGPLFLGLSTQELSRVLKSGVRFRLNS